MANFRGARLIREKYLHTHTHTGGSVRYDEGRELLMGTSPAGQCI